MVDDTIRIIASSGYSEDKLQHLLLLVLVPIASASAAPANVAVGSSADGSVLIDGHGKSLYRFGRDTGRKSTCNGERAQNWPPLLTTSTPKAGTSRPGSSARRAGPMVNCR
jgi:predicted lipoprotein with Yx(FWY)xxD motif